MIVHPFPPICNENSRILILGSFPSVKSRENMFYYGNPRNRFWKVLSSVFSSEIPSDIEGKTAFLLSNNIALWDVIHSCEITGSSDSSIRNAVPNNLHALPCFSEDLRIFANGNTAYSIYEKYLYPDTKIMAVKLPSTSPANASYSLEMLITEWKKQILLSKPGYN